MIEYSENSEKKEANVLMLPLFSESQKQFLKLK